jgi:formate hydrogenlyase subunit 6/NADH:ubiquinone oxidoreductase subunit I
MCEEACPFAAVKMSHEFELAEYQRYGIRYDGSYWKPGAVGPAQSRALWAGKQ